jgi:hypothetical protein
MSENAPSPAALPAQQTLLDSAEQAQRSGHFARTRSLLRQLAARGGLSAEDEKRAAALRERLRPDPLVAWLVLACLVLFIAVVATHWR